MRGLGRRLAHAMTAASAILLASTGLATAQASAEERPPASRVDATSFGLNIDEALVNPLDARHSPEELRLQAARIIYEARRIGARTLRWPVADVWPQYECSRDPENQATGELDPAFFAVSRALLEEAHRQNVKVLVVMADLSDSSVDQVPRDPAARAKVVAAWARYRAESAGKDRYPGDHVARCRDSFRGGYYGAADAEGIFARPAVVDHFAARFAKMAAFLQQFPALVGLEMFNEPTTAAMHEDAFGQSLQRIRKSIRSAAPSLPVYSGVPWWDRQTVEVLRRAGDLPEEPFIEVHSYLDYTQPAAVNDKALADLVQYVQKLVPDKPLAFGEAGSKTALPQAAQHAAMVRSLVDEAQRRRVGLWAWGSYVRGDDAPADYKWAFNPRSPAGVSFRPYFADTAMEARYRGEQSIRLEVAGGAERQAKLRVGEIPDTDADVSRRRRWRLFLDGSSFIGFDRLGLFAAKPVSGSGFFGDPPGAVLIDEDKVERRWAEVAPSGAGWRLRVFACEASQSGVSGGAPTPAYLIALAVGAGRKDFATCANSSVVASATL